MIRITLICPKPMLDDARHLLMALGTGPEDADALRLAGWQDRHTGLTMAVASTEMTETWLAALVAPLARPDWDMARRVDMDAAQRAQAALHVWRDLEAPLPPSGTVILVAQGMEPRAALTHAQIAQLNTDA